MLRASALLAVALLTGLGASAPVPQEAPRSGERLVVHPEAQAAIGGIKSPYCPGQMLATCPSPGAAAIRDSIQSLAEAGLRSDSIIELVLADYGQQWRAVPKGGRTALLAWLVPPLIVVLGLGSIGVVLARRRRTVELMVPAEPTSPEDERRLREAITELEEEEIPAF